MYFNLEEEFLTQIYNSRIKRLKNYIDENGMKAVVIGISGGIDSALSLFFLKQAVNVENIYTLMLPSSESTKNSLEDGKKIISKIGIPDKNINIIYIGDTVDSIIKNSALDISNAHPMIKGNIAARIRMVQLYSYANYLTYNGKRAFVEGTENESEYRTGYFTIYGDAGTDFEVMKKLYKTQVIAISKLVGIPEEIIAKKPSAELIKNQTDEEEMGITYEELDKVLYVLFEERNMLELKNLSKNSIEITIKLVEKSAHKRKDKNEKMILDNAKEWLKNI